MSPDQAGGAWVSQHHTSRQRHRRQTIHCYPTEHRSETRSAPCTLIRPEVARSCQAELRGGMMVGARAELARREGHL
jgi:hypothetical protein